MEEAGAAGPLDIYTVITVMVDQLAAIAWSKLGLQPDMVTGALVQDLPQAKIAIDLVTHLSTFIEPQLEDQDRRRIHTLIRDLRMNYVQKAGG